MDLCAVLPGGPAHCPRTVVPLQAGRAHRGLGAKPPGMGDARVRRRHGGHGAGHREPGLSRQGSGVCAEAVALGRGVRRRRLPRQSDAGDDPGGGAELPRAARDHLLRRLEFVHRRRRRRARHTARRQSRRPRHDPVYVRHNRLSEGRPAPSSRASQQRRRYRRADGRRSRRRFHHHHAAVSHRRLRLLRDRLGLEGGDPGAGRGLRSGHRARNVRDLSRQRDGQRSDHAGRHAGASVIFDHRSVVRQSDLLRRLHGAGPAGETVRGTARRPLHHRVRPDRMLAGRGADPHRRQRRGQGQYDRPAASQHGNQDHRSQHR